MRACVPTDVRGEGTTKRDVLDSGRLHNVLNEQ